ncbi:SOS-response transcriptional repressor, LexA [Proteiniborus ethanoligenes]|uniref:LexA repressor n=1 Tax=Proteiniborus ethanoligenes TaxID=415015 RepID=A0A1H3NA01_9FIRM|nr:transcriptional repressor LexA [Proteiniborus ethanoligenes]TAH62733.1 MAG: transcriptional repressor LexA [Gottschalkiaceae bacterium]SDY85500.1 SOS-response transcriptional repressor, LexA [Proteiniborus ethanoligenes]
MYEDLSSVQLKILEFIKSEIYSKGYPPAVREICKAVNLKSTSTVHGHLEKIEKKGYIRRDPTKPRAIEILDRVDNIIPFPRKEIINVPIVGKVTAGEPILAVENIEDSFPLPIDFVEKESVFMLKVRGDSMIEAGILDGDFVLVRQQNTAYNGDIVVALLDDEATIKRFFKEKDHIRLQPENQFMEPIITRNVSILGKVTGVFRKIK